MKKGTIPQIINNFHLYKGSENDGEMMLGITGEITLPDFSAMVETITGSGFLGELEVNNPGHFSAINMEIPFIGINGDMLDIDTTNFNLITMRACEQSKVKATRELVFDQMKIVVGGVAKDFKLGAFKIGGQMGPSVTLSVDYMKIEIDGETALELDKIGEIFVVNGEDKLAKIREMC